jgi:hypothetical protein
MISLREPTPLDWPAIGEVANQAVDHIPGAPRQAEWLQNRIAFPGWRRHCVAERESHVVGYGAIERQTLLEHQKRHAADHRLFLVVPWSRPEGIELAQKLLAHLRGDPKLADIEQVWLREYFDDAPFVDFLLAHGFAISGDYVRDGVRIATLTSVDWKRNNPNR